MNAIRLFLIELKTKPTDVASNLLWAMWADSFIEKNNIRSLVSEQIGENLYSGFLALLLCFKCARSEWTHYSILTFHPTDHGSILGWAQHVHTILWDYLSFSCTVSASQQKRFILPVFDSRLCATTTCYFAGLSLALLHCFGIAAEKIYIIKLTFMVQLRSANSFYNTPHRLPT